MAVRSSELNFEKLLNPCSRVLVVNPLNTYWSYQLSSELALRSRDFTPIVRWLNVGPRTPAKFEISSSDHYSLLIHGRVHRRVAKLLKQSGISATEKLLSVKNPTQYPDFKSIDELREMKLNLIPLGRMIFSAIASNLKSTAFELEDVKNQLNFFMRHSYQSFAIISKEIKEFKPDFVLTINDRLIGSAMALALAKQNKVSSALAYWGYTTDHIEDYSSSLYSGYEWENKIFNNWNNRPDNASSQVMVKSRNDLDSLSKGPNSDSLKYLSSQIKGTVIDKTSDFCVFYAQSEHEHSGHLIINPSERFSNQYEAFNSLQKLCKEMGLLLYLKLHPLPAGKLKKDTRKTRHDWETIKFNDIVQVIEADSSIDTYELISTAKFNVVWSSTVGLECIARGIQPIVVGFPLWLNREWNMHAWTEVSLQQILKAGSKKVDAEILLPYFYYFNSFGVACRFSSRDLIWNEKGIQVKLFNMTSVGKILRTIRSTKNLLRNILPNNEGTLLR
jgi:hypothetical protein